jgi:hypothetical protein
MYTFLFCLVIMWKIDTLDIILINFKGFQVIFDEKIGFYI